MIYSDIIILRTKIRQGYGYVKVKSVIGVLPLYHPECHHTHFPC